MDYYEQVEDTMEESPFLIFFDRIADLATSRNGDEVAQVFLAKVASNFFSPTTLGTLNRMREEVKYAKYGIEEYTEDGISYGELFDFIPDKDKPNILRKAFLDDVPSLFTGKVYEEGDMHAWEDVAQLVGAGKWDEETQSFIDTQGDARDIRNLIEFPYTTVPMYTLDRHTPKYPV